MGTKPKLEVNIHETTILFYTVGIESYKSVEKKSRFLRIIIPLVLQKFLKQYAQLNTSKPKIKVFSFLKVSKMVLLNFQPKNKKANCNFFDNFIAGSK